MRGASDRHGQVTLALGSRLFDRLLATHAIAENLTLVSADPQMPSLGATVLW